MERVWESVDVSQQTLCRLLGYTRQAFHKGRRREARLVMESELVLQEVIRIRRVQKRIGVRKLYHLLSPLVSAGGMKMGRDRLNELLREHGLLVRKRRRQKPQTTVSCRWRRYPNLIRDYLPTQANQVWVSDITYVDVGSEFGFLSLITDAYSRKIVGYKLSRDLSTRGCLAALRMALGSGPDRHALIHHSDRGTQYTSTAYIRLLGKIRVSMTEKGDPLENAIAERVNGILKQELLEKRFSGFREAEESIAEAISTYNHLRPHLSIDMLTPEQAHEQTGELKRLWKSSFSRRAVSQASA